jgi:hypothetical protein
MNLGLVELGRARDWVVKGFGARRMGRMIHGGSGADA